jgi:hypothetical protein
VQSVLRDKSVPNSSFSSCSVISGWAATS